MIRINLIPHRAEFRQFQIIEHIIVFVTSIILIIGLVVAVDILSSTDLTDLQTEHTSLVAQNAQLSRKIGELRNLDSLRKEVEGKLQIVDELQAGRFRSLTTLDAIAKAMPQNIWISTMRDGSGNISVDGNGESSKAVANFMRALELSDMFGDVKLQYDKEAKFGTINVRRFALTFRRLTLAEQEAKAKGEKK